MSIRVCSLILLIGTAVVAACESRATDPVAPSPVRSTESAAAPAAPVQLAARADQQHAVTLFDACDPETFNAAVGPGTCIRSGGVRFETFLEQLKRHGSIGAWHFAPGMVTMQVGQLLVANNRGGEVHTFTEVDEFGGGIVPLLNELIGETTVAPECNQLADADFLAPGASSSEKETEAGVEKYQCCIHPWMRAEVRIKEK
jgi:hypothetical protein